MRNLTLVIFHHYALLSLLLILILNDNKRSNTILSKVRTKTNFKLETLCSNWTGSVSTDWNTAANWCSGVVPSSTDDVVIPTGVSNYPDISAGENASVHSITINSSASLTLSGNGNLSLSNNGIFTNNGTFNASGTGAVIFSGAGIINGIVSFNNVTINGAVDFGTSSTINGTLLLNAGGTASGASTHLVIYSSSSTLIYNETVTIKNEWYTGGPGTTAAGAGIPQNVSIQSGVVTIPSSGGNNRALAGNLIIYSGATLKMTSGNRDLYCIGDWTNNGNFIANGEKVILNNSAGTVTSPVTQTLSGTTTFYDLTFGNSYVTTDFGTSTINIQNNFRNDGGKMNEGSSTINFIGATGAILGVASKNFYNLSINTGTIVTDDVSSTGLIHVSNSFINNGTFSQTTTHTFYFDKSGATESFSGTGSTTLWKLVVGDPSGFSLPTILNCNSSFTLTGGNIMFYRGSIYNGNNNTVTFSTNNASISGTGTANFYDVITNVQFNPGNTSAINNSLTINDNGSVITNAPTYSNTSILIYNTTTSNYNTGFEWSSNNTSAGMGVPQNVAVTNSNSVILSGDRTIPGTLTLTAGSLDINNHTLTVTNGFAGSGGNLKGSTTSNLTAGGTGTIYFDASANYLKNLIISKNADLTLGNALNIAASDGSTTNSFGMLTANGTLNANDNLTLKSDQYGDAIIGNSSGVINGNATVERYIPAKRAWRFLTVPFSSSTQTINQAWQEGQWQISDPGCPAVDASPYGYGTQITYDDLNGYDWNTTLNASLKVWTVNGWVPPSSTLTPLITDYPGYCLFVRGDRHMCTDLGTGAGAGSTTLRASGIMNETGTDFIKNIAGVNDGDYLFIGNPFASPVNIPNALSHFTGINQNEFWVWDPSVGGTHGVGAFITYSNGIGVPQSGSNYSGGDNAQSGQAFFIRANASGTATLRFQQGDKIATEGKVFGKPMNNDNYPAIYTNLMTSDGNSLVLVDGVGAAFDNSFAAKVDENDAGKFWNFDENIALLRNDYRLAIELRPFPVLSDTFFYKLYLRPQPYVLQIFSKNFPNNTLHAWLIDKYLNTKLALNLNDTTLYSFTPSCLNNQCDTNSYRNRFMVVLSKNFIATPVPVTRVANQANPRISGITNSIAVQPGSVSVTPNPVITGEQLMLHFLNVKHGHYEVTISNTLGKVLTEKSLIHNGPTDTYFLQTDTRWAAGNYFVKITSESGNVFITKLIMSK